MKNIVILGASGHAKVIADIVAANGDRVVAFLDDAPQKNCPPIQDYANYPDCEFIIGIGNAMVREKLSFLPLRWYTAIHPSAVISPTAHIGIGSVVMPNAVINAGAKIGKHCIVNTGAIIEHECSIADFSHVSVGAKLGGAVKIGKGTWVGIGASVSNNICICEGCMIGAGAVVVKDITEKGTYVGVPAKRIK